MLVPYNVDKRTKLVPFITYGLIAANIFFFLLSILISNLSLSEDRIEGRRAASTILASHLSPIEKLDQAAAKEFIFSPDREISEYEQMTALRIASEQIGTPEGYKKFWQIDHMKDSFVLEPHHSVMNTLAYRPNNPSPLARFLSMFSAMFLHADIDHLFGNMLFLWVFGRAAEEFLGRKFFSSIYIIAGIGATLIDHLISQIFAPQGMGLPSLGASGAIAGVLGLFAIRYYRTNVRVFYLMGYAWILFAIAFLIAFPLIQMVLGDAAASVLLALITAGVAMFVVGRTWAWGAFWAPSAYVIGVWVVIFNLIPALWKMATGGVGGVAYWAHIGGFTLGAVYAFAIGGVEEGKDEYKLQDAQTALQTSGSDVAMNHAMTLLQKDQNNSAAHEVMAQAYDRRNSPELAMRHFIKSMEISLKKNESEAFLKTYNLSTLQHPNADLPPRLLWHLARVFGQKQMWNETAATLTRLIETHPNCEEAEMALLRSAQIWGREFNEPTEAVRQLEMFIEKYPNSAHEMQAKAALKTAREIVARQGLA